MATSDPSGIGEDDKLKLRSNYGGNQETRSLRFNTSRGTGFYGDQNIDRPASVPTSPITSVVAEPLEAKTDNLSLGGAVIPKSYVRPSLAPADPLGIVSDKTHNQVDRTTANVLDPGGSRNILSGGQANDAKTTATKALDPGGLLTPGGRVVCTELHRKKEIDHDLYMADVTFTARLSHITVRGYQWWGIPCVRLMRRNRAARAVMKWIAIVRAEEIGYQVGIRANPNYAGKFVRFVGESACFVVVLFVGPSDWSVLYQEKKHV